MLIRCSEGHEYSASLTRCPECGAINYRENLRNDPIRLEAVSDLVKAQQLCYEAALAKVSEALALLHLAPPDGNAFYTNAVARLEGLSGQMWRDRSLIMSEHTEIYLGNLAANPTVLPDVKGMGG